MDSIRDLPISHLDLDCRADNCLRNAGCETVGDVAAQTKAELARTPNIGAKSLQQIEGALATLGLRLGGNEIVYSLPIADALFRELSLAAGGDALVVEEAVKRLWQSLETYEPTLSQRVEALEAKVAMLAKRPADIPSEDDEEEIWTTQQCADFLGMTKSKLEKSRLPHLGIDGPPFLKLGANVRYRRSVVLEWLSNNTRQEG